MPKHFPELTGDEAADLDELLRKAKQLSRHGTESANGLAIRILIRILDRLILD